MNSSRFRSRAGALAGVMLLLAGLPRPAAADTMRCRITPGPALLGRALHWQIHAELTPAAGAAPGFALPPLGPDWLLLGRDVSSQNDARGRQQQDIDLSLVPLRAGRLPLPELRLGRARCAPGTVNVATAAPGQLPVVLQARAQPESPLRGQAVQLSLDIGNAPGVVWQPMAPTADGALLRALPDSTGAILVAGRRVAVERRNWELVALRSGPLSVDFPLLRGHAFGEPVAYAVTPLQLHVRALPAYWPAGLPVGVAQLDLDPAPQRLELGASGVLRWRLRGVLLGRASLQAWLDSLPRPAGLRLYAPQIQSLDTHAGAAAGWSVRWPFRVERSAVVAYPVLRLNTFDPVREVPAVARAGWGSVQVTDPRPRRIALALALIAGLNLLLAALRETATRWRAARQRRFWRQVVRRGDGEALERAWRRARATDPGETPPSLIHWVGTLRPVLGEGPWEELLALAQAHQGLRWGAPPGGRTPGA